MAYLINTTFHLKQEINRCTPEETQADAVVDGPVPALHREGRAAISAPGALLLAWRGAMLPFRLFASVKINRLVLSGAPMNMWSLVLVSLCIFHN